MELSDPKAKKRVRLQQQQPLPLIYNEKGELMIFTSHLNPQGTCIVNPEEMEIVNSMGFFGKGSLSRHYPSFGKYYFGAPPLIRHRQWKRRQEWFNDVKKFSNEYLQKQEAEGSKDLVENDKKQSSTSDTEMNCSANSVMIINELETKFEKSPCTSNESSIPCQSNGVENSEVSKDDNLEICEIKDSSDEEDICEILSKESENDSVKDSNSDILLNNSAEIICQVDNRENKNLQGKVVVLPDSDSDNDEYLKNIHPTIENEEFPVRETLHLTFEESFFLMYALGCLQVVDSDEKLISIRDTWDYFCKEHQNFVPRYIVYHYFRSKGWVIKPGLKYGGDFLLYKDGPPFYHASYIVIVDNCENEEQSTMHKKQWKNIFGLQRLSEIASKEILFAQVLWPDSISSSNVTPNHLSQFTVKEILLRRWVPSKNKSNSDDEYDDSL